MVQLCNLSSALTIGRNIWQTFPGSTQPVILPKWAILRHSHFNLPIITITLILIQNWYKLRSDSKDLSHFIILHNIFYLHLPDYVGHQSLKDFFLNSHFENMTAGFLLRCQNTLRREICLICHWNIDSWKQKLFITYVIVPKNDQNIT